MRNIIIFAGVLFMLLAGQACKEKEVIYPEAALRIDILSVGQNEVSFNLVPENAVEMGYSVAETGQEGEWTIIDSGDSTHISLVDLKENTEYTITANATNKGGSVCKNVTASFVTKKANSPQIGINVKTIGSRSVVFVLNAVNASSYGYDVVKASEADNAVIEFTETEMQKEFEVEELEPATEYCIVAQSKNEEGDLSDLAKETFTTGDQAEAPEISVKVDSIGARAFKFTVTLKNAASFGYKVVLPSEVETAEVEFTETEVKDEYIVEGLEPNTLYSLLLQAKNEAGDLSDRVIEAVKTESEATATVEKVDNDANGAIVTVTGNEFATKLFYCLTDRGASEPDRNSYSQDSFTDGKVILYFYELVSNKDYTLWIYAANRKGFESEVTSYDFTYVAGAVNPDYSAMIKDITMKSANLELNWNSSSISKVLWTAQSADKIPSPDAFDWDAATNDGTARRAWSPGTVSITDNFSLDLTKKQRVLVRFEDRSGQGYVVCRDFRFKEVQFGESGCSLRIDLVASSHESIYYKIANVSNCTSYYFGYTADENLVGDVAKTAVQGYPSTNFDVENFERNLVPETTYYLVAVPVDSDGKFGNYVYKEVKTSALQCTENASVSATLVETGFTTLKFNITFSGSAAKARYIVSETSFASDQEFLNLLSKNASAIPTQGEFTISYGLNSNTEYHIWMIACDKYDRLGQITKLTAKTKGLDMSGTGTVEISLDEYKKQSYGVKVKLTITPDENVDKYLYNIYDDRQLEGCTDVEIATLLFGTYGGGIEKSGTYQIAGYDGNGEMVYSSSTLVVLPIDKNGKYCPLIQYKIEVNNN